MKSQPVDSSQHYPSRRQRCNVNLASCIPAEKSLLYLPPLPSALGTPASQEKKLKRYLKSNLPLPLRASHSRPSDPVPWMFFSHEKAALKEPLTQSPFLCSTHYSSLWQPSSMLGLLGVRCMLVLLCLLPKLKTPRQSHSQRDTRTPKCSQLGRRLAAAQSAATGQTACGS